MSNQTGRPVHDVHFDFDLAPDEVFDVLVELAAGCGGGRAGAARGREPGSSRSMSLGSARRALDDVIHSPVRFALMSALNSVDQADYQTLKNELEVSYALLSKHAALLEEAGYVAITKRFVGRTPRTDLALTRRGRRAYGEHLAALDEIVRGLKPTAEL